MDHVGEIEKRLWGVADHLRANSNFASNEYFLPVMGLIFLRHAYSRFLNVKAEIEETLPSRGGVKRALTKEDFSQRGSIFLKPEAQFDHLVGVKDGEDRAGAIIAAMEGIEKDYQSLTRGIVEPVGSPMAAFSIAPGSKPGFAAPASLLAPPRAAMSFPRAQRWAAASRASPALVMSTGAQIHMRRHRPTASPEVAARAERLSYRLGEVGLGEVQIARDEGRLQPAEPAVAIFSKAVDSAIPVMIVAKPSARRRGGRCEAVEQHCAPIPPRGEDQATVG